MSNFYAYKLLCITVIDLSFLGPNFLLKYYVDINIAVSDSLEANILPPDRDKIYSFAPQNRQQWR